MLTRARGVVAAVLLVVSACGGNAEVPEPVSVESPQEGYEVRLHNAEVDLRVEGDQDIVFAERTQLIVTEILGGRLPEATWFLQVAFSEVIDLGDGRRFQAAVDVAPGLYRGPGGYELTGEGVAPLEGTGGIGSAVFVRVFHADENGAITAVDEFDRMVQACSLDVDQQAAGGRVECQDLATEDGEAVTLSWSWTLVE